MNSLLHMSDLCLENKKVFIREDFNVPIKEGVIQNTARLEAAIKTINMALEKGAAVILGSHLGRPKEGVFDANYSLSPIASWLSKKLGKNVDLISDYLHGVQVKKGEVVLLENLRFNVGEKRCYDALSKQLAEIADVFVMDAFGAAHRAQASTYGVANFADVSCAGPLLIKEIEQIEKGMSKAKKPVVAIVGGSKVSSKLTLLEHLLEKVDTLIVGGGIANTFLAAKKVRTGKSLYEPDLVPICERLLEKADDLGVKIPLPIDFGVSDAFHEHAECRYVLDTETTRDDIILDIGPKTAKIYKDYINPAKTIIWNGPVGVFEFKNFRFGTESLAKAIAKRTNSDSDVYSIAGGGDTISAIDMFSVTDDISYITTGGGAFLEYIEGKELPAISVLKERKTQFNDLNLDNELK